MNETNYEIVEETIEVRKGKPSQDPQTTQENSGTVGTSEAKENTEE